MGCTGCHDWSHKHSRRAVGERCVGCHDAAYTSFVGEWTTGLDKQAAGAREALRRAEAALARERRAGRRAPDAEALVRQAAEALALVQKARGAHNPAGAESILEAVRAKADAAAGQGRPNSRRIVQMDYCLGGDRSATLGANLGCLDV